MLHQLTDLELEYVSGAGSKLGIVPDVTGGSSNGGVDGGGNNLSL